MKKITFLSLFLLLSIAAMAQTTDSGDTITYVREGVTFGSVLAIVTSWSRNKSVLWAILHGIFSWLYVIYFVITRDSKA